MEFHCTLRTCIVYFIRVNIYLCKKKIKYCKTIDVEKLRYMYHCVMAPIY